jgi:hypothetical protein
MLKGKMALGDGWSEPRNKGTALFPSWLAPAIGRIALSVDGSFASDGSAGAGMISETRMDI